MSTFGFVFFLLNIGHDAVSLLLQDSKNSMLLFGEELFNSMFASPERSACLVLFV